MYLPTQFAENRPERLQEVMQQPGLVTLVTLADDGLEASHLPMLYDPTPAADGSAPHGTLYGHLARGNPQWRRFQAGIPALAIFQGADAYITPSWYETKRETGKVVPTWNYIAVHAYGTLRAFERAEELRQLVTRLTNRYEGQRAAPWAVTDAPADYIDAMLKGIVGLALPITRLEGKWKMSQNRSKPDQAGVVTGLRADGNDLVADIVADVTSG